MLAVVVELRVGMTIQFVWQDIVQHQAGRSRHALHARASASASNSGTSNTSVTDADTVGRGVSILYVWMRRCGN